MHFPGTLRSENHYDAVLVGAGIMSATLAVLLHELDPELKVLMIERLHAPALESSAPLNNAGTGHAANCELNYTPLKADGTLNTSKALAINAAFELSLELWSSLTEMEKISPNDFLNVLPHISFVWGEEDVKFLYQRYKNLISYPAFSQMRWSNDANELSKWMPLVMDGRTFDHPLAATKIERGTDIDFGALTSSYLKYLQECGFLELKLKTDVINLRKVSNNKWHIDLQGEDYSQEVSTSFVFLGAGGAALTLLQKSGVEEALNYGGFPVSGQWLVCTDSLLTNKHNAKVYGKAKVGAPPMSVPHLDSRWIEGSRSLLFGPFAGFSSKFLKEGSRLDLINSVRKSNLLPMLQVGIQNFDLVKYLVGQIQQNDQDRMHALKDFLPKANSNDWKLSIAGQRVQIIKRTKHGGVLQMGTEVVSSSDGSLAALLGASPGASTAVAIMLEVLQTCWSDRMASDLWRQKLHKFLPSVGMNVNSKQDLFMNMRQRSDSILKLA